MSDSNVIQAPIPGTFYRRPDPDSPPFVEAGSVIEVGTVIGLIEVMKQFHELESETAGTLVEFLVENEASVEVGQTIARLG